MKKVLIVIAIAAVHFVLTKGVTAISMSGALPTVYAPDGPVVLTRMLVALTKALYFPLITLAVFPRSWFPGNLINLPIFLNSLLWAGVLCGLCYFAIRRRK
jgi:hypothetical protein